MKQCASYIWKLEKRKPESWTISNWSKHLLWSAIEKDGTEADKAALPCAGKRNRSHPLFFRSVKPRMAPTAKPESKATSESLSKEKMEESRTEMVESWLDDDGEDAADIISVKT